jgi:hypothetical protein
MMTMVGFREMDVGAEEWCSEYCAVTVMITKAPKKAFEIECTLESQMIVNWI